MTKQFLEEHTVARENGQPKVAGVTLAEDHASAIVYFAIANEHFYRAIDVSVTQPKVEVTWTEDWHRISFHATSELLDVQQLSALTSLLPTHIQHKGDERDKWKWPYRAIKFEPNPEPDSFETKLEKLLTFLAQDAAGTRSVVDKGEGYIHVISEFYNGNTSLASVHFTKATVHRMAVLNLAIDFNMYAVGNKF